MFSAFSWSSRHVLLSAGLALATLAGGAVAGTLTGSASWRERMILPPGAVLMVELQDVSRADAPSQLLARLTRDPAGNPPVAFRLAYDDAAIEPGHRYLVSARVTLGERLLFITDMAYPVRADGSDAPLDLRLVVARGGVSDAPLRNTYWKLVRLDGQPVTVGARQREPHLILSGQGERVSGSGGCNRLMGAYTLDGEKLGFARLASTMMACLGDGMAQEQRFLQALARVAGYSIRGEQLVMLDAAGQPVASFEAVALR